MAAKRRVLVAEEVSEFADRVAVPADVEIEWLPAGREIPSGDYVGLLPLLTRRVDAGGPASFRAPDSAPLVSIGEFTIRRPASSGLSFSPGSWRRF